MPREDPQLSAFLTELLFNSTPPILARRCTIRFMSQECSWACQLAVWNQRHQEPQEPNLPALKSTTPHASWLCTKAGQSAVITITTRQAGYAVILATACGRQVLSAPLESSAFSFALLDTDQAAPRAPLFHLAVSVLCQAHQKTDAFTFLCRFDTPGHATQCAAALHSIMKGHQHVAHGVASRGPTAEELLVQAIVGGDPVRYGVARWGTEFTRLVGKIEEYWDTLEQK